MKIEEILKSKIRSIPDFPKKGIIFRDITTLLNDKEGFRMTIDAFIRRYCNMDIDFIAGIEARGFLIGGAIAYELRKGLVPIRKEGKLPYETVSHEYELEYGSDTIEVHIDSVKGDAMVRTVIVMLAAVAMSTLSFGCMGRLISEGVGQARGASGRVVEIGFIVELPGLGGGKKILDAGYSLFSLVQFEGE